MDLFLQKKLLNTPKMYQYLKENSYWIKFLNRDPALYKEFESKMKELYKERPTDKISEAIDGIVMISGILTSLK